MAMEEIGGGMDELRWWISFDEWWMDLMGGDSVLVAAIVSNGLLSFTEVVAFDLMMEMARNTGRPYWWASPVPMVTTAHGTTF